MNEREFFTQALLSSHSILMAELMPVALPDNDDELDAEVVPVAEKTALIAALYATELTIRWRTCMAAPEEMDGESSDIPSSTDNLTKPPPESPSSEPGLLSRKCRGKPEAYSRIDASTENQGFDWKVMRLSTTVPVE
jgi:hypothetical protein